jgi:hypothetical protein
MKQQQQLLLLLLLLLLLCQNLLCTSIKGLIEVKDNNNKRWWITGGSTPVLQINAIFLSTTESETSTEELLLC